MLVAVSRILGVVLGEGLVGGHDGVGGGVPEPYGPAQGAHPRQRPPGRPAPNRAPAPTTEPGCCLAAAVCTRSFLPQTPTLVLPKDQRPPAQRPSGLPNGPRAPAGECLLSLTFVHFAAISGCDSCTGSSSWQLSPEPAPPATRSVGHRASGKAKLKPAKL